MPPPRGTQNVLEGPGDYDVTTAVHSDTYAAIDPTKADLNGRTVFVVGGSKGIGKETVLSFAKAGVSQLAVGARSDLSSLKQDIEAAANAAGKQVPQFAPVAIDVINRESVEAAAKSVEEAFGRLDILVIVAGAVGGMSKIVESDPDKWWSLVDINVRGPYLVFRSFIPLLLKTEGGLKTVCSVASVGAFLVSPTLSHYQTAKTALVRLAEFVAAEHAGEGIVSFSVHPGNIPTTILGPDGPRPELKHIFVDTTRVAADTIVWLTKENRYWVNGRYINCTWDMPQLEARKDDILKQNLLKTTLRF